MFRNYRDKVTRQCPQTTTSEEKGQPKRIRTEVPPLTSRPNRLAKRLAEASSFIIRARDTPRRVRNRDYYPVQHKSVICERQWTENVRTNVVVNFTFRRVAHRSQPYAISCEGSLWMGGRTPQWESLGSLTRRRSLYTHLWLPETRYVVFFFFCVVSSFCGVSTLGTFVVYLCMGRLLCIYAWDLCCVSMQRTSVVYLCRGRLLYM